jgi:uncharacterized membrane-anchored protein
MAFSLRRNFGVSKVPNVTLLFWVIKLLTTAMGEATSDFFVHKFSPILAVLLGAVVFAFFLWRQLIAPTYKTFTYWTAIVMVSVFGTMCADVVHVGLGVPYAVSTIGFASALLIVFVTWFTVEGTLSIHSITTSRRELFYWLSIVTTFALGTALGDLSASLGGLGYLHAGLLFCVLFAIPGIFFALTRRSAIACFWASYILTRPFGASFADWLGVSRARGGENWGPGHVALLFSALIVLFLVALRRREGRNA